MNIAQDILSGFVKHTKREQIYRDVKNNLIRDCRFCYRAASYTRQRYVVCFLYETALWCSASNCNYMSIAVLCNAVRRSVIWSKFKDLFICN